MPTCPRCASELAPSARFCTQCGASVAPPAPDLTDLAVPAADQTQVIDVDLVRCPRCGASNAARRIRCGRCQALLHDDGHPTDRPAATPAPVSPAGPGEPRETPPPPASRTASRRRRGLAAGIVVVGLLLGGGVGLAIGLGVGPFAPPEPVPFVAEAYAEEAAMRLPVATSGASSARGGEPDRAHGHPMAVDGELGTAWIATGQDAEPRLLHGFRDPVWVAQIEVGTGWQADPSTFRSTGRVTGARIDLGTVLVDATIADRQGVQILLLPDPVLVDEVSWQVTEAVGGPGAVAEVRYVGWPARESDIAAFRDG